METTYFEFIKNKKGQETLLSGKYRYNISAKNKYGTSRWRCVQRDLCSATLTLNKVKRNNLRSSKHCCSAQLIENTVLLKLNAC